MTFSGGGTPQQLRAREFFRRPNPLLDRNANVGLADNFKLRPGSRFSQDDLDAFNRRQDEARRIYGGLYGQDALKDIQRFDRVEDIPVYTEEEIQQQKIERRKADPRSAYNYKRPKTPAFGEGPRNQKVPQAVVDAYNNLQAKFGQLRENIRSGKGGSPVTQADFDALKTAGRNAEPEFIQPGEVYLGPDFRDPFGNLLRENPDSVFFREDADQPLTAADLGLESAEAPTPAATPGPFSETPEIGKSRAGRERKFSAAVRKERRADRAERREIKQARMDQRKAKRAARMAQRFKRMQNR